MVGRKQKILKNLQFIGKDYVLNKDMGHISNRLIIYVYYTTTNVRWDFKQNLSLSGCVFCTKSPDCEQRMECHLRVPSVDSSAIMGERQFQWSRGRAASHLSSFL